MNREDFAEFAARWRAASMMQVGDTVEPEVLKLAFDLLAEFDLSEVGAALTEHCKRSRFQPLPSELRRLIEGELPANEELVALAQDGRTPLGRMLAIKIGSDLARLHPRDLVTRMSVFRDYAEDLRQRALVGEFSEAEIRALVGSGIDPTGPLGPETAGPRMPYRARVQAMAGAAKAAQLGAPEARPAHRTKAASQAASENLAKMRELLGTVQLASEAAPMSEQQRMASRERLREYRKRGERLFTERAAA